MGDAFKRVKPGDDLDGSISASAWNTVLALAEKLASTRHNTAGNPRGMSRDGTTIRLRNDTGDSVPQFGILGVGEAIFDPADGDGPDAYTSHLAFAGVTPDEDEHEGLFAVALEPADAGEVLTAAVAGVFPVQVNVTDEDHEYAEIADGNTESLASAKEGSAIILRKAEGTGVMWCLVRIGAKVAEGVLYGTLDDDAASAGWKSVTPCTVAGVPTGEDAYDVWIGVGSATWYGEIPAGTVIPHATDDSNAAVALGTARNVCSRIDWEDNVLKSWPITDWGLFATVNEDNPVELLNIASACAAPEA